MSTIPERLEFKFCGRESADNFVKALSSERGYEKVAFYPATENSHFERYGFVNNNKKVTVVYDIKAFMLSVTAFEDLENIRSIYEKLKSKTNASVTAEIRQDKTNENYQDKAALQNAKKTFTTLNQKKVQINGQPKHGKAANENKQTQDDIKKLKEAAKTKLKDKTVDNNKENLKEREAPKTSLADNKAGNKTQASLSKEEINETQGGLSFKKYSENRFNLFLAKIKRDKKYKLLQTEIFDKDKDSELKTFSLSSGKEKIKLRFMPKKQVVQLQGKKGILYGEIQLLLSEQTDFKTAAEAHIKQNNEDTRVSGVERQLKKLIPNAVAFLSEQSKIDFTIGVIEILNSNAEHYDYSMLLLPPFRGLERLIMDLQHAQGVVVKMIGQAYEKNEGNYVLKQSYRRKIDSVIYAEVMAALYREYFETRNYYAHSASEESDNRMINDKKQAEEIFKKMLEIVDYNCKKLSEIGFSI